jgi:hypothetical protein
MRILRRPLVVFQKLGGAAHPKGATLQNMGVNHGDSNMLMAYQFLDGADVMAALPEMGCKKRLNIDGIAGVMIPELA